MSRPCKERRVRELGVDHTQSTPGILIRVRRPWTAIITGLEGCPVPNGNNPHRVYTINSGKQPSYRHIHGALLPRLITRQPSGKHAMLGYYLHNENDGSSQTSKVAYSRGRKSG